MLHDFSGVGMKSESKALQNKPWASSAAADTKKICQFGRIQGGRGAFSVQFHRGPCSVAVVSVFDVLVLRVHGNRKIKLLNVSIIYFLSKKYVHL